MNQHMINQIFYSIQYDNLRKHHYNTVKTASLLADR